jgi:hypothetical protein
MKSGRIVAALSAVALMGLTPVPVAATTNNNESATYQLHLEVPNVAMSADGDTVTVTGEGEFGVHPKSITAEGTFTLTNDGSTVSGNWTAEQLLAFQPYGCGVVRGNPIPPNFCGGMLLGRITLTPSTGPTMEGILRVVCIIGDVPGQYFVSKNATEGINLNVVGVDNYNKQAGGMNVFIKQS